MAQKNRKNKEDQNPMRGFRKTGSFTWQSKSCDVWINGRNQQLMFCLDGKPVEDPAVQDEMMKTFLQLNAISRD